MAGLHRPFDARQKTLLLSIILTMFLTAGCTRPFKAFDVGTSTLDPNLLPLNPKWGQQIESMQMPTPSVSCPLSSRNAADWVSSPQYPNCTSIPVYYNLEGDPYDFGPCWHINFEPVSYTGYIWWESHSGSIWDDDDYSLNVTRDDQALYSTLRDNVHIEFNSEETVDHWNDTDNTWWDKFHHNGVDKSDSAAHGMIDKNYVLVIGLLGLDADHGGITELHPVYSLFVHLKESTADQDHWSFFVRNWGDEGSCSDREESLHMETVKILVPGAVAFTGANTWEGAQNSGDLTPMGYSVQAVNGGMLLTFKLLPSEKKSWIMGDLTFKSKYGFLPNTINERAGNHPAGSRNLSDEGEGKNMNGLRSKVDNLSGSDKRDLYARLHDLAPQTKAAPVTPTILNGCADLKETRYPRPVRTSNAGLGPPKKGTAAITLRQKKIELIRKYLKEKGVE